MRSQVLQESDHTPRLKPIAADLAHLFTSWFNRGFLVLRRIDWRTSAVILEKLIQYEAVHQIQGWHDLRRRLEADRRCYAFFHPALPDEPIIFIEVALTRGLTDTVQALLDPDSPVLDAESAEWAIFYSITNCQEGLRGVPFGSFLIKRVVEDLSKELPRIKKFATLSPVPGFRKWLAEKAAALQDNPKLAPFAEAIAKLDSPQWMDDPAQRVELPRQLLPLAAYYLCTPSERRAARSGGALPPQERRASGAHQLAGRHFRVRVAALGRPHRQLRLQASRTWSAITNCTCASTKSGPRAKSKRWPSGSYRPHASSPGRSQHPPNHSAPRSYCRLTLDEIQCRVYGQSIPL